MTKSITQVRRDNLERLINERFGGRKKDFADAMNYSQPGLVSRYLSTKPGTKKNIGSTVARKIELVCKLPENWMDSPHPGTGVMEPAAAYDLNDPTPQLTRELLVRWERMPTAFREYILMSMARLRAYTESLPAYIGKNMKGPTSANYAQWEAEMQAEVDRVLGKRRTDGEPN